MSNEPNILKFKGVFMYPKLFRPDTTYEHKWCVDLLLDEEHKKIAEENNLRVYKTRYPKGKPSYDPYVGLYDGYDGSYIRLERKTKNYKEEDVEPPVVKDAQLRDIPSSINIGNGTIGYGRFIVKDGNPEHLKEYGGYGCYLLGAQILKLEEYESNGDGSGFDAEDDGFTVDTGGFDNESDGLPESDSAFDR